MDVVVVVIISYVVDQL